MKFSRRARLAVLTVHVAGSTAWTALLTAVVALQAASPRQVDFVLSDRFIRWWVVTPLAAATTLSGLALSLGTAYGLTRWRWMVLKLYLVCLLLGGGVAVFLLPDRQPPISRWLLLTLLVVIAAISASKPGGRTRLGQERHVKHRRTA